MSSNLLVINKEELRDVIREIIEEFSLRASNTELVKTEPDIIDVQEASQFLDLTVGTIYVLNTQKKIPVLKYGRKLKFSKAALQEWNEAGRPALEDNTSTKLVDAVLKGVKLKRSSNT